jgi:hypothetical protein
VCDIAQLLEIVCVIVIGDCYAFACAFATMEKGKEKHRQKYVKIIPF